MVQLTVVFSLLWATAPAQVFYDFENGLMPEEFTLINGDMLTPALEEDAPWADTAWIATGSSRFAGFAALSISWYTDEMGNDVGPCDDWLILPKITLGDNAALNFQVMSATSSGDYPDDYWVLINTEEPTIGSFEENGELLWQEDDVPSVELADRTVDLADYAGQTVYLAFRNVTNGDGYGLYVDNIEVTNGTVLAAPVVDNEAFQLALMPNPATETATLAYSLEAAAQVSLSVQDLLGRTLRVLPQGQLAAGPQTTQIDVKGLAPGTYIVSIRTEDKIGTTRLVVRR